MFAFCFLGVGAPEQCMLFTVCMGMYNLISWVFSVGKLAEVVLVLKTFAVWTWWLLYLRPLRVKKLQGLAPVSNWHNLLHCLESLNMLLNNRVFLCYHDGKILFFMS